MGDLLNRLIRMIAMMTALWIVVAQPVSAARAGLAELVLQRAQSGETAIGAAIGDTLSVEMRVSAEGEPITGINVFLTLDSSVFRLVSVNGNVDDPHPFEQGAFVRGTVFQNRTIGDRIGEDDTLNGIPGFQLNYFENITGSGNPKVGTGNVATFRVVVVGLVGLHTQPIKIDRISPIGDETGYFVEGDPGTTYGFRVTSTLEVVTRISPQMADFNGDRSVSQDDFLSFADAYGNASTDHDLNRDGLVDFSDFLHFAETFGTTY